jgi:hypothetical protein
MALRAERLASKLALQVLGDAATAGGPDGVGCAMAPTADGDAGGLVEVPPPSVGAELGAFGAGATGNTIGGLGVISFAAGATG